MPPAQLTPPTDPAAFLPWALLVVLLGLLAIWRLREGDRKSEVVRLEALVTHERTERARERTEHAAQLAALGARLDAMAQARADDQRRMTRLVLAARPEPASAQQWEAEAPTGVRHLLACMPGSSDPLPELAGWDPTQSTPPGAYEPPLPPRRRMPSRPR